LLIAVAFGISRAQAAPLQIDNWDDPFPGTITTGTNPGDTASQSNSPITNADPYFGTVSRTVTLTNGSPGSSSSFISNNELCFDLNPGSFMTLEYQFSSSSVLFPTLSAFFSNESSFPYTVAVSWEKYGQNTWNYSGTVEIEANEPDLELYTLPLGSGTNFVGGLQLIYSFPLGGGEGCLCGVGSVPEIDPATGGSVFSLVAGVLAMIEQRRRRGAASTAIAA
jgi:hypothetical protein